MRKTITILFPCVGRRVSLIKAFRQAAKRLGLKCTIIGTDKSELSPAMQCCDKKFIVQAISEPAYMRESLKIIKEHKVDLIVPTIDLDLVYWAHKKRALQKLGCRTLISKTQVVEMCQDKRLTAKFLKEHQFNSPETISRSAALKRKKHSFPYFLKPWDGYASRGNAIVNSVEELKFYCKHIPNCLVQQHIQGHEYTSDVYVDFDGNVQCVVPRLRIETRSGEVSKGKTVRHPQVIEACQKLVKKLGAGPGIITIQCMVTMQDEVKIIEINPRFGGGAPLAIKAGANFPLWILTEWLEKPLPNNMDRWKENLYMLRYDQEVWL